MTTPDTRIVEPQRTCIGCRQTRPQSELVRCAVGPQGANVSRTAAGRGAWLCSMNCYQTAVQRKAFDRSWKQSVSAETLLTLADTLPAAFDKTVFHKGMKTVIHKTVFPKTVFPKDMKESSVVGITPGNQTPRKG